MLSKKDAQILSELRKDARTKLTDISKKTGIPTSTVHERLKEFRKQGIRLVSILDYPRIHTPLQYWFLVKAKKKKQAEKFLEESPYVNVLLKVNNGADFAVECIFSTFKQQHEMIQELKPYGRVKAYPVIEELGRELADPLQLI